MTSEMQPENSGLARLVVAGVGGAGGNAIRSMVRAQVRGVEFVAINTDAQALAQTGSPGRLRIGERLTRGLGAGGNPEVGLRAAEESRDAIRAALSGADMVFITAGMGGGTGTGASPAIAMMAREAGALTVAIVSTPFNFEGEPRRRAAERGLAALREQVDTLVVVPNERLLRLGGHSMRMSEAYALADDVLRQGVQAISDLIAIPGHINLDFADVRAVMEDAGSALMSVGVAGGEDRAVAALRAALTNPVLEVDIAGARAVLVNITAGSDLMIQEAGTLVDHLRQLVHADANILFGTVDDPEYEGQVKVTLVATGFEPRVARAAAHAVASGATGTRAAQRAEAAPGPRQLAAAAPPAAVPPARDREPWAEPHVAYASADVPVAPTAHTPHVGDETPHVGPARIAPAGHPAEPATQPAEAGLRRLDLPAILRRRR